MQLCWYNPCHFPRKEGGREGEGTGVEGWGSSSMRIQRKCLACETSITVKLQSCCFFVLRGFFKGKQNNIHAHYHEDEAKKNNLRVISNPENKKNCMGKGRGGGYYTRFRQKQSGNVMTDTKMR